MRSILTILTICILSFQIKAQTNEHLIKGYVQLEEKNYQQALDLFNLQLEENQLPKTFLYRGICNYYLNEPDHAKTDLLNAFTNGRFKEAQLWLAKVHAQNNEAQKSIKYLDDYITSMGYIYSNNILKDSAFKPIRNSNSWQEFTLKRVVSNEEVIAGEVEYLLKAKKYNKGVEYISNLLIDSFDAHLYYYRALFYKESGNLALAYADIKFANKEELENLEFLKEFLQIASDYGKHEQALSIAEELILLEEENPYWRKEKAISELNLTQASYALSSISIYLQYYPYDEEALYIKAKAHIEVEEFNDAIRTLNIVKENFTTSTNLFLLRGNCYLKTKTFKSAAYDFSMCLDLDPTNEEANLNLGIVQFELGNTSSACFYWERALQYGSLHATEYIYKYCE